MYFYIILEKRRVKKMIWFEMKKIFLKRVNQVVLLVLLAIVLVGSFLTIRDVQC